MLIRLILLSLIYLLIACNVTEEQESSNSITPDYISALNWAKNADAKSDAQAAIAKGDTRFYVVASRGLQVPGIDSSLANRLKDICGAKIISGSTDVIYSDEHLAMLQKAYDYASEYNQIIAKHCS